MVDPSVVALSARVATIVFGTIILASCILQFAWAACSQGSGDGTCKTCGATIGGVDYCSVCNGATYAPVNGECVIVSSDPFCTGDGAGACSQCGDASFLFKGGAMRRGRRQGVLFALTPRQVVRPVFVQPV